MDWNNSSPSPNGDFPSIRASGRTPVPHPSGTAHPQIQPASHPPPIGITLVKLSAGCDLGGQVEQRRKRGPLASRQESGSLLIGTRVCYRPGGEPGFEPMVRLEGPDVPCSGIGSVLCSGPDGSISRPPEIEATSIEGLGGLFHTRGLKPAIRRAPSSAAACLATASAWATRAEWAKAAPLYTTLTRSRQRNLPIESYPSVVPAVLEQTHQCDGVEYCQCPDQRQRYHHNSMSHVSAVAAHLQEVCQHRIERVLVPTQDLQGRIPIHRGMSLEHVGENPNACSFGPAQNPWLGGVAPVGRSGLLV